MTDGLDVGLGLLAVWGDTVYIRTRVSLHITRPDARQVGVHAIQDY